MKKWFLILLGTGVWLLTMVKSGLAYPYGIGFWGANAHDGVWHLALIEGIIRNIIDSLGKGSLTMPVFSGGPLQNYHLGFDLLAAFLHIETGLSVSTLYFQVFPVIFAFAIGYLSYLFVKDWTKSERAAFWATFFVYFGGGLGWLVTLVRSGSLNGESMFWSQQAISTLINPPFALSLIFILLGLIFWQKRKLFLSGLFFGILIEIKIYAGVLVLGGLLVSGLYGLIKNRDAFMLRLFLLTFVVSVLLFFLLGGKNPQNLLVFQPFWFLETMMGLSDRFGWPRFHSAMTTYRMGKIWLKALPAYGIAFVFFILGNFGTRILALGGISLKKITGSSVFLWSMIAAGVAIPMFFLQKGTPWNTIQFLYYALFFSALLAGVVVEKFKKPILVVVVLFTIPTTIGSLKYYLSKLPPAIIPRGELEALRFLKNQSDGVVLTFPFDAVKAKEAEANPPRPLYLYDSTAYVSAYADKEVFLEDQVNLDIMGYDWKKRLAEIKLWYREPDEAKARGFLAVNKIKYVYWLKADSRYLYATEQRAFLGDKQLGLDKIFENESVVIYVVKSEV